MLEKLRAMTDRHPHIGQARGLGLMIGVDMVKDKATREPAHELMEAVLKGAYERGLLLLGCGASVMRFAPPLNITADLADEALAMFDDAVGEAEADIGGV
jgi:4-aminobutyrate aminotransferase